MKLKTIIRLVMLMISQFVLAARADYISFERSADVIPIADQSGVSAIHVDPDDFPGVLRAAADLSDDFKKVFGKPATLEKQFESFKGRPIIVGTIGKSRVIDQLGSSGKLDLSSIKGKWESGLTAVVNDPFPGVDQAIVIAGSDKRGTIYGIYELSRQIGVSPWYWWADVPPQKHEAIYFKSGRYEMLSPKVKYRGIFINDEEPCFGPWARERFGGINSKMYVHMYELILRLKGNYLWPAMWGKSFYEADPESARLADEFGIVIGTSHHEPMMRAHVDWEHHKNNFGGIWNYATNEGGLKKFWAEGIERNKNYETTITLGMRGDGDEPMVAGGDMQANHKLLEKIVTDQRQMIAERINPDVTKVPQVWALYKEVADYYAAGMRVPDDVTLLWCDDNWGNLRRLPTEEERKRTGGAGIYYHFDYVGSPRNYKWLNTNPLPKVWEQMNLAYRYGANQLWVVNVGDLKPMELPIDFFLTYAWNPEAFGYDQIDNYTKQWAREQFGSQYADTIADIVSKYAKYNAWRKPEVMDANTFSLINYNEADRVLEAWRAVTQQAEDIGQKIAPEYRDAYYQFVLYPTKASANHVELYIAAAKNHLYAKQGRASANDQAALVEKYFELDHQMAETYHKLNGGKWNHMMAQTHLGYSSWRDPPTNILPKLDVVKVEDRAELGVAIEGSESAWPDAKDEAKLPAFDSINQQRYWIDLFRRSSRPAEFSIKTSEPWIKVDSQNGKIDVDKRITVDIDWSTVPEGEQSGEITIQQAGGQSLIVKVSAIKSNALGKDLKGVFGGLTGPIAINAESAAKYIDAKETRWVKLPDYGRGSAGMMPWPADAKSAQPGNNSPRMEYPVLIAKAGEWQIDLLTSPTLNFLPDRGVRIAVSVDDGEPVTIDAFAGQNFADPNKRPDPSSPAIKDWGNWVRDNARTVSTKLNIASPGVHTLKVWMVDAGLVLEKITLHREALPKSYFGPPAK